jgi:MFS family permease
LIKNTKKEKIFTYEFINIMFLDLLRRICHLMQLTLLPLYIIERGFPSSTAGLMITFYLLTATIFRPSSGILVDKKGSYAVMLLGSSVYCFATGFYMIDLQIWPMFLIRAIQGFGFSFHGTALMTMATNVIPERRMSEGLGYMALTQTIGQAFSPLLVIILRNTYGFKAAFLTVFAFTLLMTISGFILKFDKSKHNKRRTSKPSVLKRQARKLNLLNKIVNIDALKPSIFMLFIAFVVSGINAFLVPHAAERGIVNPGIFFTVSALMVFLVRISMGRVLQIIDSSLLLAIGMMFISIGFAGLFVCFNILILIIAGVFYGLGTGITQPQLNALAVLATGKEQRGMANSTFFMSLDLGFAIGAVSLGAIADFAGMGAIFGFGSIIALLTCLAYLILRKNFIPGKI